MSETSTLPRFHVDFSEAALDGFLSVFRGDVPLRIGQVVELYDDEGNTAAGTVDGIDKHVAWVVAGPRDARVSLTGHNPEDVLRALLRTPRLDGDGQ